MSEIASRVQQIVAEKLGRDAADVKMESNFVQDLGADSLDTVELIMAFETEFNVTIPDDEAEKIKTVGDAVAHLESKVK